MKQSPSPAAVRSARGGPWIVTLAAALSLSGAIASYLWWRSTGDPREGLNASRNNLNRLGIAIYDFGEANFEFPPDASYTSNGQPLLSWRVHLLPYLKEGALHRQFRLDEPWDSPHNKKLIAKMPNVYRSPGLDLDEGETCMLAVVDVRGAGGSTLIQPPASFAHASNPLGLGRSSATFGSCIDGLSNTAIIVEADPEQAVPWTQPGDLQFDPDDPSQGMFGAREGGALVTMGDSSVKFLSDRADDETLRRLFGRNDRQAYEFPDGRPAGQVKWPLFALLGASALSVGLAVWCIVAWTMAGKPRLERG
jgi:hypothetical protein